MCMVSATKLLAREYPRGGVLLVKTFRVAQGRTMSFWGKMLAQS